MGKYLKRKVESRPKPPRYLRSPDYGARSTCGGTQMIVTLGPAAALPENYGSGTSNASIPTLMRPLHVEDPGCWVAGHLLNDNLGGSGTYVCNLTPLTKTANRNHATYEGYLKRACERAMSYHRRNPDAKYWYGVYYKVVVSHATFGNFAPYNHAPSHITISAHAVKQDKSLRTVTAAGLINPLHFNGFTNVEIHNDDAHL